MLWLPIEHLLTFHLLLLQCLIFLLKHSILSVFQILLKGASGDELKKVKHVIQYGVFAAYHLALETSFLADEGASLPELPLKSPITVALPDKPSSIDRSISIIPGFSVAAHGKPQGPEAVSKLEKSNKCFVSDWHLPTNGDTILKLEGDHSFDVSTVPHLSPNSVESTSFTSVPSPGKYIADSCCNDLFPICASKDTSNKCPEETFQAMTDSAVEPMFGHSSISTSYENSESLVQGDDMSHSDVNALDANRCEVPPVMQFNNNLNEELKSLKEEFPPSPSDHQSILVSLSTRCVWKGTVCERAHLFRIKYYGSFDKPLGRFLRGDLFDQVPFVLLIINPFFLFPLPSALFQILNIFLTLPIQ